MKLNIKKLLKLLLTSILISTFSPLAKAQINTREQWQAQKLRDQKQGALIKSDAVISADVVYGANINWKGENEQLKLDVYTPPTGGKKYPLLLFIHGGGFLNGNKSAAKNYAKLMVAKKFVFVSINYRLGWTKEKGAVNSAEASEATYRALQDTRASLRYLVANADKYNIDTNWIFVTGSSAGGVASLNVAFHDAKSVEKELPGITKKLGPIDAGNSLTNKFTIKAIVPMWGAVNRLDLITKKNAIPTLLFHGAQDKVVPYDIYHWYVDDRFPLGYGSKPIYELLTSYGVPAVAYIDPTGGHGAFSAEFRADITGCFLDKVMKRETQTGYYISHEEIKHNCP